MNYFDYINGNDKNEIYTVTNFSDSRSSSMLQITSIDESSDYNFEQIKDERFQEIVGLRETYPDDLTVGTFIYHANKIRVLVRDFLFLFMILKN